MKRATLAAMILVVALGLAACGDKDEESTQNAAVSQDAAASQPLSGDAENGKALFATTCAACHGPAGEGVAGLGKDMTASTFIAGLSDAELLEFVKQGRPPGDPLNTTGVLMPPKGGNPALTDAQLVDILAYVRSIHIVE